MRYKQLLFLVGALFFLGCFLEVAPAFSFMYIKEHDLLPRLVFEEFATGREKVFSAELHHPLILIFWGADIDTKRQRAATVLDLLQDNLPFYSQRQVEVAAVFVQPEQLGNAAAVLASRRLDFPVYVDTLSHSFDKLGVYVMPSFLIVDQEGRVHRGVSYSHNLDAILPGEVQVMLHEKSRAELNSELHPEVVEKSGAERRGRIDYHYALNLIQRRRSDLALEKLDMALEKIPDFPPALIEKGCLLIKKEKLQEAHDLLERGLALFPGLKRGQECVEELKAAQAKGGAEKVEKKFDPSSWGFFADDYEEEDEEAGREDGEHQR